jgi:uncharacterized protein YndB with AHSA1/START domain
MPEHKSNVLILEKELNAPSDLVWKAFTEFKLLKQWMPFFSEFKAEVGFETRFPLGPDESHQYRHIVRVLEVIPHKKLTYTWYYEGYSGKSHVSYELFPQGQKTKVVLTHTITEAFPDSPHFAKKNFVQGWTYMIDELKKFVEGVKKHGR